MSLEKEAAEGMNVFCCESLSVTRETQIYHSHLAGKRHIRLGSLLPNTMFKKGQEIILNQILIRVFSFLDHF